MPGPSHPHHPLDSQFVRDQLALRAVPANDRRLQPEGEYVLYWMQACDRLEENWALRYATLEANRLNRPLIIHHGLGPSDPLANDRQHQFILEGAKELAEQAEALGYDYHFWLRRTTKEPGGAIDQLARRAAVVVTDDLPTAGVNARTQRFAERAPCRVMRVESFCVVPAASFHKEEYAARTIRPKLAKLRDLALEPVRDEPPRKRVSSALRRSLEIDTLDVSRIDIAKEVARCDIDHSVGASAFPSGRSAAHARLDSFLHTGAAEYSTRREEPADVDGSSQLSPYLHFGHIAPAEVARAALAQMPRAESDVFLDQLLTWRELSFNFCSRNPRFDKLRALPQWAIDSLAKHTNDAREAVYTLAELEQGQTHDPLWNAAQHQLVRTGMIHNVMRMLWGKSVILWSNTYATALRNLLYLNNKYAIDGFDPASYANILWCFGKFDRPFAKRPVWGIIRPMSLARAREKFHADLYIAQWS